MQIVYGKQQTTHFEVVLSTGTNTVSPVLTESNQWAHSITSNEAVGHCDDCMIYENTLGRMGVLSLVSNFVLQWATRCGYLKKRKVEENESTRDPIKKAYISCKCVTMTSL